MRRLLGLLAVTALAVAGCGSSSGGSGGTGGQSPKQLFAGTCGSCHTLKAAGTDGTFGPDLDQLKPTRQQVRSQIAHGGGGMPSGLLQGAQANAVAAYVAANSGR
jgi:mono/diheme cytochrome c family protein